MIRGVVLPYRLQEKLPSLGRGAPWGSRQNCTGSVGSAKAGAAVETLTCNFCKPRARWPGRTRGPPLRFCAPEIFCPAQGITPVMGAGESSPMDLGEAKRSRSPSAASPAAKLPCVQRIQSETCPLIRLALRPATFPPGGRLKKERRRNSPRRTKDAPALALNDQRGRVLIFWKEPKRSVRTERPRPRSSAACVCGPVWCRPHSPAG